MAKYMLIYTGGMGMAASPEEQQKIMDDWGVWYGAMGPAIVDGGAPFGEAKNVGRDGVADGPLTQDAPTGYTVIDAESLDAAAAACANHPHITHGGRVEVFSCIDMSVQQ